MTHQHARPWYCPDSLVDDYRAIADAGGDLKMLKTLKILRSILVNLGIIAITLVGILTADGYTAIIAGLSIVSLALYNGVEVADYAALAQAFVEARQQTQNGGDGDGS